MINPEDSNMKHFPALYCLTSRGLMFVFDSAEEAQDAYQDAKNKGNEVELIDEDRLLMLGF